MCIIVSNEPKYCACLCVNNVLYVYNCIHEKVIKPSCVLYLEPQSVKHAINLVIADRFIIPQRTNLQHFIKVKGPILMAMFGFTPLQVTD